MSSITQFLPILAFLFFLKHSVHTLAGNFPTPHSSIDNFANYDHCHSGMHLVTQDSIHSAPKLRKQAFGLVNTIATGVTIVITILNIVVYKLREIHEANLREKYTPSEQLCRRFLLGDILLATENFEDSLVIGQGGFRKVYKRVIDDGTVTVAIKRLNPMSKQGSLEFWAEIEMLSRIRHSNIVSLIGYCDDCDEMILVYEYMIRGTLGDHMHKNGNISSLPWGQRVKICIGAARGLDYLHSGTGDQNRIIHRDVKSSNILLGENWTAKISDFGMSKIGPTNQVHTHVSTIVKGTFGYVDPEYFLTRQLTRKSDVYAFGVVLFEVLCGRRAVDLRLNEEQRGLAGWAQQCIKEGKLDEIIDPNLRGQILSDSLTVFAQIADQCLHMFSTKRPTMAEVVVALIDFSIFEEFFNTGGNSDNQENVESSIKEEVVINKASNNKENAVSSVKEQMVINANKDLHHYEQIEGIMQLDGARNDKSHVKPAKTMAFTKMVRQFFFGTSRVISALTDAKPTKNSKSNNNNGENPTLSSKNGDIVQHVPPSGHIGDPNLKMYTFAELGAATRNFRTDMVVGEGSFGKSKVEFWGKFSHPNLVKILGYCFEDFNFFLVQEYMRRGSLENYLFKNFRKQLPWVTRLKIAIEAARGLAFLHKSDKEVTYYQFKTSNILLDGDFNAKLSDFKPIEFETESKDLDSLVTRVLARKPETNAHAAPEYTATGHFSLKSDVYGFGVVLLEILSGQRAFDQKRPLENRNLVKRSRPFLIDKRRLKRVMDPHLDGQYSLQCALEYAALVGKCVASNPQNRPSMEKVLKTPKLGEMVQAFPD
ncbi:hypothetical protein LguiA_018913 [Lonicera macranthoides]